MSRRMPMTPMTSPAGSRREEALRVVGMASPEALRGLSRTLRVTPRSTTSPRATMSSRIAETQELEDRLVRQQDLALEVGDEDGVRSVGDDEAGVEIPHRSLRRLVSASTARLTLRPSRSTVIPTPPEPLAGRRTRSRRPAPGRRPRNPALWWRYTRSYW